MKFNDITKFLKEESGQHTTNIFLPSIHRDVPFKPLTTSDVKTLARIGIFNEFDLNNELLKLSLFDKLVIESKESCGLDADSLTQIDFLSFLIGIRKLMNNEISFSFTCKRCEKKFDHTIDLETEFSDYIFNFERKTSTFEKLDNQETLWKFELGDYTMKEYLYYRYYLERLKDIDGNNPDILNEAAFIRPVLYIKKIYRNDEEIDDWTEQLLSNKIRFLNMLPSEIIIDPKANRRFDPESCLSNHVIATFDEEKMFQDIEKMAVKCPHCGEEYRGMFKLDDFFMF